MKCSKCMAEIPDNGKFCPACGEKLDGLKENAKKRSVMSSLALCGATIALVAGAAFYMNAPKGDVDIVKANLFYVKDRELLQVDLSTEEKEPVEYSDLFRNNDYEDYYFEGLLYGFSGIRDNQLISKDGSIVVYPTNADGYGREFSLYSKLGDAEPVKLENKVEDYKITDNNLIVYKKSSSGLYVSDGKDKKRIDPKADMFYVNDEGTQLIWSVFNEDEGYTTDIYYQNDLLNGEKARLAKDAHLMSITDNFDKMLIKQKNSLYVIENLGEPVKLLEDVDQVKSVNLEKMTFYYVKAPEEKRMVLDYIEDDSAEYNSREEDPDDEDTLDLGTSDEDFWSSYYYGDNNMEQVKQQLQDQEAVLYKELYYYNNGQETLIDSSFREFTTIATQEESDLAGYIREKDTSIKKVKLSDIPYADYALYEIEDANYLDGEEILLINGVTAGLGDFGNGYINQRWLTGDSSRFYFAYSEKELTWEEENAHELYYLSLADENFGEIIKVDEGIENIECLHGTDAYYIKNCKDYVGDLYADGNLILRDVNLYSVSELKDKSGLVCISDIDIDESYGTLTIIKDGVIKPIADRVSYCDVIDENNIVLLREYNENKKRGDLEYYDGENIIPIDQDVFGIFPRGAATECYAWSW